MSVPFSNTHLRVPRGFGTILEGLAREVLRDQPEDIPKYAAQYFEALLKQRDESGMDPAEWAAKLEDRFYNNHAFKASPDKEATEATTSKEQSLDSQTEDESSHPAEALKLSTPEPSVSEKVDLTESTGKEEEQEQCDITEKQIISSERGLSEEESVNRLPDLDVQPDELNRTEDESDSVMTTFDQVGRADEKDIISVPDQDIPQSTDLLSFRGISNVDVCAEELGTAEDEGEDKQETVVADKEIMESEGEEQIEDDDPVEVFPYTGLADVDVCSTELGGSEKTIEGASAEDDTSVIEEESSKPEPEETVLQSLLSQSETPVGNQQVAEDQVEKQEEEGTETETSSGEVHESLTHTGGPLDSNVVPKGDSLVEISFEDIPEAQQIKEVGEKQPEEEDSAEVSQTKILEMQQEEESEEVAAVATDQNALGPEDHNEHNIEGAEKEVNSEGEEVENQHEASDIMKKVDTNNPNLNDSEDDEQGEGVKTISSSHHVSSEADKESPEDESDPNNEDNTKINEGEFYKNEPNESDFKEEETIDTVGGVEDNIVTEGCSEVEDQEINDGSGGNYSLPVTQSYTSTAAMEAESETLEGSAQQPEENEESQRTLVESQLEETLVEKEVTSKERTSEAEGLVEEGKIDSEIQEESDAMCEEGSVSLIQSPDGPAADLQGEERPFGSEKNTTGPEGSSGDKQEDCSRPQEEEDIMDIPLDDPEANRAAAKIQAGFRGHMTRKKMKPEDKAEGEEVSSTGDVLNGSQGDTETGGSGAVEGDDTSVPEQ